jgi:hypothetical protein
MEKTSARFEFLECIGDTGSEETYLLLEKETKDLYVLKTQRNTETNAISEADLLNGLEHKGLPQFEKSIEHNGIRYILRRFIAGKPLNAYLAETPSANPAQAVDTLMSICDILIYLHSQPEPIIHRDIKPSNIIINPENNSVTLIDFGISRRYSETASSDTTYFGTHKYAPPEQYGFAQTDCRTDIYSLGVVMRYWLTGSPNSEAKITDKTLERIAAKCTEFAPKDRYQSAESLKKALSKYKNQEKRRIISAATGILCGVVLFIAGFAFINLLTNQDSPDFPVPFSYDENDLQKMTAFFRQGENEAAMKAAHDGFDIDDPATWTWRWGEGHPAWGVTWTNQNPARVQRIYLYDMGVGGYLDLSGFDQLLSVDLSHYTNFISGIDLSGCVNLQGLLLTGNELTELDVSGLTGLGYVGCADNNITSLDVSGCINLTMIDAGRNQLDSLDLSDNTALISLYIWDNKFTSFDASHLNNLAIFQAHFNRLTSLTLSENAPYINITANSNRMTDTSEVTGRDIIWEEPDFVFWPQSNLSP